MTAVQHNQHEHYEQHNQHEQHEQHESRGDKRLAEHLRVHRTRARPQKTLFGSVLEPMSNEELERLAQLDSKLHWQQQQQKPVPVLERAPLELLQQARDQHLPDIQRSAQEVEEYQRRLQIRQRRMNLLERDAKFIMDLPHPLDAVSSRPPKNFGDRPRWMTKEDLANSDKLNPNFLGRGVRNFNRDKYGRKAETHRYALVGDLLRAGMDFDETPAEPTQPSLCQLGRPDRLVTTPRTLSRQRHFRSLGPATRSVHGVQLPANLQHAFGTEVCSRLLQNPESVQATSRLMQQKEKARVRPPEERPASATTKKLRPQPGDESYEQLGNALRSNVFGRSHAIDHRVSSNHQDYTRMQFDSRPDVPDKWRYQKDHVSKWAEANVLEMRMKKALDERMERLLHKTKATEA